MTGKTHKMGGMLVSVIGFTLLKQNGLLLPDVNEGIQWLAMYPFCMWGSIASDLDHHWDSCPSKDIPSWFVHKALHITEPVYKRLDSSLSTSQKKVSFSYKFSRFFTARHRSWQTHSDLTFVLMLYLLYSIMNGKFTFLNKNDVLLLTLIVTGVCLGVVAHFILDLLTPEGVWNTIAVFINRFIFKDKLPRQFEKWHFVPKLKCFATGSSWEDFIYKVLKFFTVVSVIYLLVLVFFPTQLRYLIDLIPYRLEIG